MRKLICLVALIWTVAADVPTLEERNRIMELHTQVRESVEPTASNMMFLRYSSELETLAQGYIVNCSFAPPNPDFLPENVSEIFHLKSGARPTFDEMLQDIASRKQYYDYEKDQCTDACFDYRQMIYAKQTAVGCAQRQCTSQTVDAQARYLTMCLYKPSERYFQERPYKSGVSCSECPEGYICRTKQCFSNSGLRNSFSGTFWLFVISNLLFLSISSTT
uniref:SCP domain-containing protein n=1 Tax=Mesocestoides corti TaxID=53468 RepID=A0A5K3FSB0_MESCO